jgi:peptidoglycan/xylan/chitin deacetylase (PgdA/CDA1 family)
MRTLMYHDIATPGLEDAVGFPGPLARRYKLPPDHFEGHLAGLAAAPVTITTELDCERDDRVLLTFDDGGSSATDAAAALERRGWRGLFFVTTERIGTDGFLSADELRGLARRGHVIGSHSHTHPTYMGRLPRPKLDREWRESRAILAELLGSAPAVASVPGGFLSAEVISAAEAAGYDLLFTSEPTTRVSIHRRLRVRGRYTIWASTPVARAVGYARGDRRACGQLWLEWNAKKAAKRLSPGLYQSLRRTRARFA